MVFPFILYQLANHLSSRVLSAKAVAMEQQCAQLHVYTHVHTDAYRHRHRRIKMHTHAYSHSHTHTHTHTHPEGSVMQ